MQVAPVLLRVLPDEGGSVRIEVSDGAGRPAHAVIDEDTLAATSTRTAQLLRPSMGVLLPGQDRQVTEAEQQAGRLLAALVRQPSLAPRLDTLLGHAAGAGQQAVVVVDAEDPRARALPWELLADAAGDGLELSGIPVVRRLDAPPAPPVDPTRSGVGAWSPSPDDPVCARRLATLDDHSAPAWLHVVCHGTADAQGVALVADGAEVAPTSAAHALGRHLRGARAAILEVCDSAGGPTETDTLASAVLRAGARACVAPRQRLAADAAAAFASGFHAHEANLLGRLLAGRAAVRALASPRPDARWHVPALHIGDLRVLSDAAEAAWPGWPPTLAAVARAATARAVQGFVGIEHLLDALAAVDADGRAAMVGRSLAAGRTAELLAGLGRLTPKDAAAPLTLTPHLRRVGAALPPDASTEALWELLLSDVAGFHGLLGLPIPARTPLSAGSATHELAEGGPARGLRVLGGPEDGRRLSLRLGDSIGRASSSSSADHRLYDGSPAEDGFLSRRALVWGERGRVDVLRKATLHRAGETSSVQGVMTVLVGDVLTVGACTRLLGVP